MSGELSGADRSVRIRDLLGRAASENRLDILMVLHSLLPANEWWCLLGEEWSGCDNVSKYRHNFAILFNCDRRRLRLNMMNQSNRAIYENLPDKLTVYRGCYSNNIYGLSWSLDRKIAEKFPFLDRYRQKGQRPILVTRKVKKSACVYIGDRNEAEIIAPAWESEKRMLSILELPIGKEAK
jgi:hypothetical protein